MTENAATGIIEAAETTETPTEQKIERGMSPAEIRRTREELSISRAAMAELTGISLSRIWASEQDDKTISDEHYAFIVGALARVREHGLPEHLQLKQSRKTNASIPLDRLSELANLLTTAKDAKTLKDVKAAVEQAQALLETLTA